MKNTEWLYTSARKFQDGRKAITETYEKRLSEIESAKGSKYYEEEAKAAEKQRDEAIAALKDDCGKSIDAALHAMEKANRGRKMTAPTEEELRILQVLKLKQTVTESELEAAANSLSGSGVCLSVLNEIARAQGSIQKFQGDEMAIDTADEMLKGVADEMRDFLSYDTSRAARVVANHNNRLYGTSSAPLPKRSEFHSETEFYEMLLPEKAKTSFCKAINGEE